MNWRQERRPGARGNAASKGLAKPLARSSDLVIEEALDEVLVYDQRIHRAHCLSATAAQVWRRCDGRTSVEALGDELDLDAETVRRALADLGSCELLEPPTEAGAATTRRELTIRAARVGAVAATAPLIVSIAAPPPAHAVTLAFCRSACPSAGCPDSGACGNCCTAAFAGCCCCRQGTARACVPGSSTDEAVCKSVLGPSAQCRTSNC